MTNLKNILLAGPLANMLENEVIKMKKGGIWYRIDKTYENASIHLVSCFEVGTKKGKIS